MRIRSINTGGHIREISNSGNMGNIRSITNRIDIYIYIERERETDNIEYGRYRECVGSMGYR